MDNCENGPYSLHRLLKHMALIFMLSFMLTACTFGIGNNTTTANPTSKASSITPTAQATATATPSIQLGKQTCPKAVSNASYWEPKIPTQAATSQVENIICANLMGRTTLQALISVRHKDSTHVLDLHLYDNITDPNPKEIFQLTGLYKGETRVSVYNTVLTSEVNKNSPQNQKLTATTMVNDLQREFKWSDGKQTLVPVTFPGLFPSTTRYQAEDDQQEVNQGREAWKLSATKMATTFVASPQLLGWHNGTKATIISGGGEKDVEAVVKVENSAPADKKTATITMTRLENNANGGIWIVTKASCDGLNIDSPEPQSLLKSPVTATGTGAAFEGVIGKIMVFDSHYNMLGTADVQGKQGNGNASFSTNITYTPTFKTGSEDGTLVLFSYSNADGSVTGIAIVKQLLS
ncbi:hypothetical protein KDA_12330 [Dictyobacter alpinus]|uniref:Bacterial spore germination immunoglobulin-like domain-containing protein n=1 Tax=Dictyobacter alpinus TaxID=2014873 RepID=A0A402B326_9CHLR|nr:Gmad2 immunoglobulin-like domain-containing protein [Dictyobacter alpinus]GCE25749.1 hypothetical protein KDA_12330 [Dictyobacter alpinus]